MRLTLMLVDASGTVLDSTRITSQELESAQESPAKALITLNRLTIEASQKAQVRQ